MPNCLLCGGTGQYLGIICPQCRGDGLAKGILEILHSMESVAETLFKDLVLTCKVAGCINTTEYGVLSDAAKDGVKIALSCGFVDMREGQWARTVLWSIFGEASLTRAALIAMFG